MANAASKDRVAADLEGPDYKGTLDLLRNRIKAKKDKVSGINGEISGIYDQIEKKGVNKAGARMFLQLDGKEEAERRDILRTIQKLAEVAGWDGSGDLVDDAEGKGATNVVTMPKKGGGAAAPAAGDDGDEDGDVDADARVDPATFKSTVVNHLAENSDLAEADAYVIANRIYDDLTTAEKEALSRRLAVTKADEEMADWPEEEETKQ